jgi:hypothetical protein
MKRVVESYEIDDSFNQLMETHESLVESVNTAPISTNPRDLSEQRMSEKDIYEQTCSQWGGKDEVKLRVSIFKSFVQKT